MKYECGVLFIYSLYVYGVFMSYVYMYILINMYSGIKLLQSLVIRIIDL